jgi:thioesterase domain-containing protein/acyl carrier protein
MDDLKGKIASLSPAKRALLEQRLHGEKGKPANLPAPPSRVRQLSPPVVFRSEGKGTPLVLFHYFSSSQLLAKYLGSDRPVYAVDGGFDADLHQWEQTGQLSTSVETLAERCVTQLKMVQPHGPYFLAGFCFGGTLAFEAASRLWEHGDNVAFLGLMDSFYSLEQDTAPMVMESAADHGVASTAEVKKASASRIAFMRELLAKYKSEPGPGNAVLFRAMEGRSASDRTANGWEKVITGRIQLEDCQTIRAKFFDQPMVHDLVGKLAKQLSIADARLESLVPKIAALETAAPQPEVGAPAREFVPPGTPTEIILTRILRDILRLKQVGINDNFFELGGDSLLAVRLISQIKRSLGFELPIPVFFQNPTIKQLAAVLDEASHNKREAKIIPLQSGSSNTTLYLLDVSMGLCRLAEHLKDANLDIFGTVVPLDAEVFEAAARNELDQLPTLEIMAAAHTALIQEHQPLGPILLGGHSFGGSMSFEVAHQLHRAGRRVEMIFLLDSWATFPPWWKRAQTLNLARARESLVFRAGHLWRRAQAKLSPKKPPVVVPPPTGRTPDSQFSEINRPVGDVPWEIWEKIYVKAGGTYRYRPLASRGVLFRTQHSDQAHLYRVHADLGWSGVFKEGFEMVEVPGDHFSLLKEPEVLTLAKRFKECLGGLPLGQSKNAIPTKVEDLPASLIRR